MKANNRMNICKTGFIGSMARFRIEIRALGANEAIAIYIILQLKPLSSKNDAMKVPNGVRRKLSTKTKQPNG